MSDLNIATASRAELDEIATELGVSYPHNTSDATARNKIKAALGEPEADAPVQASAPVKAGKRYKIIVATHDQDKQPVQVGVNGRPYVIQRGKEVVVPEAVVEVLRNAVQHVYDPHTMEENHVMAYPFQVLGEA